MNTVIRNPRADCLRDPGLVVCRGNMCSPVAVGLATKEAVPTNVMPLRGLFFFFFAF